jgi:hypothetical protein
MENLTDYDYIVASFSHVSVLLTQRRVVIINRAYFDYVCQIYWPGVIEQRLLLTDTCLQFYDDISKAHIVKR